MDGDWTLIFSRDFPRRVHPEWPEAPIDPEPMPVETPGGMPVPDPNLVEGERLRRERKGSDFKRTWEEYKQGFDVDLGRDGSHDWGQNWDLADRKIFWLGLEKVHQMTRIGRWQLAVITRFRAEDKHHPQPLPSFRFYNYFKVESELLSYMLLVQETYDKNRPEPKDMMDDLILKLFRQPFSTVEEKHNDYSIDDNNNDYHNEDIKSCAEKREGGWWFRDCDSLCYTCFDMKAGVHDDLLDNVSLAIRRADENDLPLVN